VSALLSLLQEKIITESKISSLIFPSFLLDVLFSKWFNLVNKLTANVGGFVQPGFHTGCVPPEIG
jgi:hypothetical protein